MGGLKLKVQALALATLLSSAACAGGETSVAPTPHILATRSIDLRPCRVAGLEEEVRCGALEVLENRSHPGRRRIPIHMVVLPAHRAPSKPPLFILQGGPGQAASDLASFYAETFADARADRDIILIDQRGTGKSNPLRCMGEGSDTNLQGFLRGLYPLDAIRRCRAELEKTADLRHYTTAAAMDDLEEVRTALGFPQISLYGTSYGTRAALVYLRAHSARVESMILKGVTPLTDIVPLTFAADAQRALDIVLEDCAQDPDCSTRFPTFKDDVGVVLRRVRQAGVTAAVQQKGGSPQTVVISEAVFATSLRSLLQSSSTQAMLPALFRSAAGGDYAPFADLILQLRRAGAAGVYQGMQLSVVCSEDAPLLPAVKRVDGSATFLGNHWRGPVSAACREWPRGKLPSDFRREVRSNVPVLLISGFADPATPPRGAERVRRFLPNSRHVVVRYGSHSFSGLAGCVDKIMTTFLGGTAPAALDVSCAGRIRRPSWTDLTAK